MILAFTPNAVKDLARLSKSMADRIVSKMEWFAVQKNPLAFAKPLKGGQYGSCRFRIGQYRVLVDVRGGRMSVLFVLAVRHRKEAYQL
mgnify:CR=1 FL=1